MDVEIAAFLGGLGIGFVMGSHMFNITNNIIWYIICPVICSTLLSFAINRIFALVRWIVSKCSDKYHFND